MKRAGIMSQKYILRDLLLRNGGRMLKNSIRMNHSFRGWEWKSCYALVHALRDEFRGIDGPYGYECWEVIGDEVVALESKLALRERDRISYRTHRTHEGSGERTIQQNLIYSGRIKKEIANGKLKIEALNSSNKSLGLIVKSSHAVREAAIEIPENQGSSEEQK